MITSYFVAIAIATSAVGQTSNVTYVRTMTTGLTYPARLAEAPGGGVFVTDPPGKAVVSYDAAGVMLATYPIAEGPLGIAVHNDGRIFISRLDGKIGVYSAAFASLGVVNPAPLTLSGPNDIAFDPVAGELYSVDSGSHRVLVFAETAPATWTLVRSWGMEGVGLGQFSSPQAIALDPDLDRVLVTDADNFRVQVFNTNGIMLFKFGYRMLFTATDDTAWFARSEGLAVDGCSNIYITDALMGTLRVFSSAGKELSSTNLPAVGYGTAAGQLRSPCGLLIDLAGKLYVANTNNNSVETYNVTCTQGAVATVDPPAPRGESGKRTSRAGAVRQSPASTTKRMPDSPLDVLTALNSGEYCAELDLNSDGAVDIADVEIAVDAFGMGTLEDFAHMAGLSNVAEHPTLSPPHVLDLPNRCGRCHSMDGAPGGMLSAAGQENLCQSCHSAGKIAGKAWVGPGNDLNSHPWGVVPDDLDPQSDLALHLDEGKVRCATCHEPHVNQDDLDFMRIKLYDTINVVVTGLVPPAERPMTVMDATLCGECHADIASQWHVAGHSHEDAEAFVHYDWAASNRSACRQCHSGFGYIDFTEGVAAAQQRGNLRVIDCLVCHATHGTSQDASLLRIYDDVTLPTGQLLTDIGPSATCAACHNGRSLPPIPNPPGISTPHYLSGGVMLEGINGISAFDGTTYSVSSSNHTTNAGVDCTVCHMAPGPSSGPEMGMVGGHTFKIKNHDTGFENVATTCGTSACHPGLTTINRIANGDYDGDAVTEGVQDETRGLLTLLENALGTAGAFRTLLDPNTGLPTTDPNGTPAYPYWTTKACSGGSRNGLACSGTGAGTAPFNCPDGGACNTSVATLELATVEDAIWNWEYVDNSGDFGVKNTGYAVGLLQVAYKGVTNNPVPGAAYRYSPAP